MHDSCFDAIAESKLGPICKDCQQNWEDNLAEMEKHFTEMQELYLKGLI